ncbi:MAG: tRNA (guanosine(37)-N1)-methyltransferase TrmD [Sumerlaeia bacterium]
MNHLSITILTLFPAWFEGPFGESILGRARERGLLDFRTVDLRPYGVGKHRKLDDTPYGGGGGMLLKPEPIAAALDEAAGAPGSERRAHVLYTSPRGRRFVQDEAKRLAELALDPGLVILCGHYEGLDERVIETRVDEEVSLGDFVLTGGEIAAMAIADAVARMAPGVLGNDASAPNDSFFDGLLEGPHYTRPEVFEGRGIPPVLLSGHHAEIERWRREESLRVTRERRPDLYDAWRRRQRSEAPPPDDPPPPTDFAEPQALTGLRRRRRGA